MFKKLLLLTTVLLSLLLSPALSQQYVCKTRAFAALKPFPKLQYKCRDEENGDYDEKILKYPERVAAIRRYAQRLEKFTDAAWWQTDVKDLNFCDFRKKPGIFRAAERKDFEESYFPDLRGNNTFRMISVADPCYQSGYNGSNLFLLYRKNGKVFVSEIFDGYFSRADFGPAIDFAILNNEQIIEIATMSGGLYPTITNYYFTIDKKTNKTVPKNLFKGDGKMTNEVTSWLPLGGPEEYGLPPKSEPLVIIKNGRLTKSFNIFNDLGETTGDDNHALFKIQKLRWNGKFYE
jgi:hypothetical protein